MSDVISSTPSDAVNAKVNELIAEYTKEYGVIPAESLADMKLKTFIPKAKAAIAREAKEANIKVLIDFAKQYASSDNEPLVLAAATALSGAVKGTRNVLVKNGKTTPKGVIATLFTKIGDTVTLNDVFAKFRMGADSMKGAIKIALKGAAPADRKWISYNASTEVYTLEAIGDTPPTGWTGYMPLDKATEKAAATA